MSYLVLARKWRPQAFDEVIGQPHVTKTLQNAIQLKRIAHAYLFTGARGVGKTSVARILAKTLNCEADPSDAPCNACSNCREITQGSALDVLEIDGASNRGIDSIRELRETVRYRPAKSRYKIYIIDEVHMLTTEAFNALLKTLEEPPEHVLFIMATTEPHKIPQTILSRCQRFDFRRIPTQLILKHLRGIVERERVELSEPVLYAVAREADGSMRDGQSLLEQLLAFSGDGLSDEEVLDVLGVVDRRSVHRVVEAILEGNVPICLRVVSDLYRRGIDNRRFCQHLCDHFRNLLFFALGERDESVLIELPEEERKLLKAQADRTTPESLYLYFQMILKGEEDIRRSTLPRITLEMLLLRLTQLPRLESFEDILGKLSSLEKRLEEGAPPLLSESVPAIKRSVPSQTAPPQPTRSFESPPRGGPGGGMPEATEPPPGLPREASPTVDSRAVREKPAPVGTAPPRDSVQESPPALQPGEEEPVVSIASEGPLEPVRPAGAGPLSAEEVLNRWPAFLTWLQGRDPVLAARLTQSRITEVSASALHVEVLEIYEGGLRDTQTRAKLTEAAGAFYGQAYEWVIEARSSFRPEPEESLKPKRSKVNPKRLVMEHPTFQQALEILGGDLVEIHPIAPEAAGDPKK